MPFPLNLVFLNALMDVDFVTTLLLTEVSASLYHFIFEEVLTMSSLCHFLRKHQYALQHDKDYFRLFSNQEIMLLHRAFEALRCRHGKSLYDQTVDCLGPLLARTPSTLVEKSPLPTNFTISQRRRGRFTLKLVREEYHAALSTSWMHMPEYIWVTDIHDGFYSFHAEAPNQFLREDFLFCKRYIDDYHICSLIVDKILGLKRRKTTTVLDKLMDIREAFKQTPLDSRFEKSTLQGYLELQLRPVFAEGQIFQMVSENTFITIFELPEWMKMWTKSELGRWYALGLYQYGPGSITNLIDKSFRNKGEALLWLFLGAHRWFHEVYVETDPMVFEDTVDCCHFVEYGREREYVKESVGSISQNDRIWLLEQIVQRAPEYGVCRYLGTYLFKYFVIRDTAEADLMLSVLVKEITTSRLQYMFEFAVSLAVRVYQQSEEVNRLDLKISKKYADKLMRPELALYSLLKGQKALTSE